MNLTSQEIITFRIRCVEAVVSTCSKMDMTKDEYIAHAEKVWQFATRTITEGSGRQSEETRKVPKATPPVK